MAVLIDPFEVPVEADERLVAGWERARDFLAGREGFAETALHRALREDADFRFVNVARVESVAAWRDAVADPAFPGRAMGFASHPGLYEVAHEDGTPPPEGGVVLINPFEVPDGADDEFLTAWDSARGAVTGQRGYLGTRLHRALGPADFRFVNVARWSSPLMFAQATQRPEFQQAAAAMPFTSHPALYTVVRS
jgi:heme oxygenase (mycobilin-producing)